MRHIFPFFNKKEYRKEIMSEADFAIEKKEKGIGLKSSLIEYAAYKRSMKVERLSERLLVVESNTGQQYAFFNMNGNDSSRIGMRLCDNKYFARNLLKKNGITVVDSECFGPEDYDTAVKYVGRLGFPVVVKPINLARGKGITTNIRNMDDFEKAWKKGFSVFRRKRKSNGLLVERYVTGEDFRFFVTDNKVISATHRKRANVVGDGKSTINDLIKNKNIERAKNPYLSDYLIPEDLEQLDVLNKENIDLNYIPSREQEIILRSQSNLSAGGDSIDVTDNVHPDYNSIAIKAVQSIPGIKYAGVDIITPDITIKPTTSNHIVSEVEFSPAPLAHFPYIGKGRDMAGAILDYYLEKKDSHS